MNHEAREAADGVYNILRNHTLTENEAQAIVDLLWEILSHADDGPELARLIKRWSDVI